MGYQVQYGKVRKMRSVQERGVVSPSTIIRCFIALFAVLGICWGAWNHEVLRDYLIPGDADITSAAVKHLTESLEDGVPLPDAVTAFCKEIVAYGISN